MRYAGGIYAVALGAVFRSMVAETDTLMINMKKSIQEKLTNWLIRRSGFIGSFIKNSLLLFIIGSMGYVGFSVGIEQKSLAGLGISLFLIFIGLFAVYVFHFYNSTNFSILKIILIFGGLGATIGLVCGYFAK